MGLNAILKLWFEIQKWHQNFLFIKLILKLKMLLILFFNILINVCLKARSH